MRILPRFFTILLLLQCFLSVRDGFAERMGPLLFTIPEQRIDASYHYQNDKESLTSTRHEFYEDYVLRMKYGFGRLSILQGNLELSLRGDQDLSTSGTSKSKNTQLGFQYDINGVFFERSSTPGKFSATSSIAQVATPFSPTYLITNTTYSLGWALKNLLIPINVEYLTGTAVTDGQIIDYTRDRNEWYLHASNFRKHSTTFLDISRVMNSYTPTVGATTQDNRLDAKLGNQLSWNVRGFDHTLDSVLRYSETTGINFAQYLDWTETVRWDWGQGLRSGVDYSLSTISGDPGTQAHDSAGVWVQQQLFKSLTTRLLLRGIWDSYPTGYGSEISGNISFGYTKKLPRDSVLTVDFNKGYSVNDRNLGVDKLTIFGEKIQVVFGTRLFLAQPNVIASSVVVRNADPLKRVPPYNLNIDYQLVTTGALTEIVPIGGTIPLGDTLLITYDYQVDPNIRTTTDSYGLNSALLLFGGDYRLYSNATLTRQDYSGQQALLPGLTAQESLTLGLERKWDALSLLGEYSYFDSSADNHQGLLAQARYNSIARASSLNVSLIEQYLWYAQTNYGGTLLHREPDNHVTATLSYSRQLSSGFTTILTANFIDTRGAVNSDSYAIGGALNMLIGKLGISLDSSFGLHIQGNEDSTFESVRIRVTRYF
jgi:hypothetical protein